MSKWVEYRAGTGLPLIVCVPHDGQDKPDEIDDRDSGIADSMTRDIGEGLFDGLTERFGVSPHLIMSKLHRSKLDPNRDIEEAAQGDKLAEEAYNAYHDLIAAAKTIVSYGGPGLLLDIHGQNHGYNMTELGYLIRKKALNASDYTADDTSIRSLVHRSGKDIKELIQGDESFGGLMSAAGCIAVPSNEKPTPEDQEYYRGGYTVQTYGSKDGGELDAIQIEVQAEIRVQKYGGGKVKRDPYTKALVGVVADFLQLYYDVK